MRVRIKFVVMATIAALTMSACAPARIHPPGAFQHVTNGESGPALKWGWTTTIPDGGNVSMTLGPFHNIRAYDVKILSVTPIDVHGSVTVVGVDVAGPERSTGGGQYQAFPPADPDLGTLAPAAGYVIHGLEPLTDAGYDLIVGLASGGQQRSVINGFHIVYEANGAQYAYNEPAYVAVCAPPTDPSACRPNDGPA